MSRNRNNSRVPSGLAEDDLAYVSRQHDGRDGGRARADADRQTMVAEPGCEATGVALEPQARELNGTGVSHPRPARERRRSPPLDEERQRGLGGGLLDAR